MAIGHEFVGELCATSAGTGRPSSDDAAPQMRATVLATTTFRDGEGAVRDTDIGWNRPVQSLAVSSGASAAAGAVGPSDTEDARLPSFILRFAEPPSRTAARTSPASQLGTETFEKGEGGARDTDVSASAAATETHVANPIARDTDIEQLDFAPIGARRAPSARG